METPKTVAAFCQNCQKFIAVVPVRRMDRVYVPLCPKCVPPTETMYESVTEETCERIASME